MKALALLCLLLAGCGGMHVPIGVQLPAGGRAHIPPNPCHPKTGCR